MATMTATHLTLNFNSLSYDKFEELCFWLVDESGEYELVEYYGGSGDKKRDVIGYTFDGELDYYQCKRYDAPSFSILRIELDEMLSHIETGAIKKPRRIYFVLSSVSSPDAKDRIKAYAIGKGLPSPAFWEPVILDKKVKKDTYAKENFFDIKEEKIEIQLPEVDTTGLIAYSTNETRFQVINNGEVPAIDCHWEMLGLGWGGYTGGPPSFDLDPGKKLDLRIAMPGQFMGKNPIKELRLRFTYRDRKNNWFYSERYLNPVPGKSGEVYIIDQVAGKYSPAKSLDKSFTVDSIKLIPKGSMDSYWEVNYAYGDVPKILILGITLLQLANWRFTDDEVRDAVQELANRKILQMIRTGKFQDNFNPALEIPTQKTGFDAYQELRDSIK